MASSIDNLDLDFIDQLLFPPPSFDTTVEHWLSDADIFAIADQSPSSSASFADDSLSHLFYSLPSPSLSPDLYSNSDTPRSSQSITISGSGSDFETDSKRKRAFPPGPIRGRVAKRKPWPSKKAPTTFIAADADNFQRMVQQATGLSFPPSAGFSSVTHHQVEVLKPEAKRIADIGATIHACLPTLDTSAFLLNHHHHHRDVEGHLTPPPTGGDGGRRTRLEVDKFGCFPTLDSWKVM